MIRTVLLLGVLLAAQFGLHPAHAQPASGFDAQIATSVYAAALAFMVPRIVDPEPVSKLTQWGLQGITALDPGMTVGLSDGKLRLMARDKALFEIAPPKDEAIANWVPAAVAVTKAAVEASPAVRRVSSRS